MTIATDVVRAHEVEDVGKKKKMETTATLYKNGLMTIETYSSSSHWCEGLRGRVFVICVDNQGNAIWVTKEECCTTRGSRFDPTCPSHGKDAFQEQIDPIIAKYTASLDIVQDDGPLKDWREQLKGNIRATQGVGEDLKNLFSTLK